MTGHQNFVLVPDDPPPPPPPVPAQKPGLLSRLLTIAKAALPVPLSHAQPPAVTGTRPRLIFAVDATASREPAWAAARQVTDALVKALPGELDVALAIHGGGRVHTFTNFTNNPATLRDQAAGIVCQAGYTKLLPILATSLQQPMVRVVIYIGDVFEESASEGRRLADSLKAQNTKLIVLHDTAEPGARRDAEVFWDLAKRTGGCVIPFDANAPHKLRDLLSAVAVYAVGGEKRLRAESKNLPGAVALLEHLGRDR